MSNDKEIPSDYQAIFFIVPSRILELPNLTLSDLRVYETIFQFWNHGKDCFLTDSKIMQRTGLGERAVRNAYIFFEKCGELERKKIRGKRYFVQPTILVETNSVDNHKESSSNDVHTGTTVPVDRHKRAGTTGTNVPHNKKNVNKKNLSKRESSTAGVKSTPAAPSDGIISNPPVNHLKKELSLSDFESDENIAICSSKNLDINIELEKYKCYIQEKGTSEGSYAGFKRWLLGARPEKKILSDIKKEIAVPTGMPEIYGKGIWQTSVVEYLTSETESLYKDDSIKTKAQIYDELILKYEIRMK